MPDIQLKLQTVSGLVTVNGSPANRVTVVLLRSDGTTFARTVTATTGRYTFTNVPAGNYTVRAARLALTQDEDIRVVRGANTAAQTINFAIAGPTPTPAPTPTPTPAAGTQFVVGQTYQISVPFADSTAPTATTTPAKAFTVPPTSNGVTNYHLFRFNPLTQGYEELTNNSTIRRGEGYFLQPVNSSVSIRQPTEDATRKPMTATQFTVTLRLSPSLASTDPHNGFNLIGSPFNPNLFVGADWLNSQVILPNGRTFNTVNEAVAAGVMSANLFTFDPTTGNYQVASGNLTNYTGYYVRTFMDGVRVVLKANAGG